MPTYRYKPADQTYAVHFTALNAWRPVRQPLAGGAGRGEPGLPERVQHPVTGHARKPAVRQTQRGLPVRRVLHDAMGLVQGCRAGLRADVRRASMEGSVPVGSPGAPPGLHALQGRGRTGQGWMGWGRPGGSAIHNRFHDTGFQHTTPDCSEQLPTPPSMRVRLCSGRAAGPRNRTSMPHSSAATAQTVETVQRTVRMPLDPGDTATGILPPALADSCRHV